MVLKQATVALRGGRDDRVQTVMGASTDWKRLQEKLLGGQHDDLYLWLDELLGGG